MSRRQIDVFCFFSCFPQRIVFAFHENFLQKRQCDSQEILAYFLKKKKKKKEQKKQLGGNLYEFSKPFVWEIMRKYMYF